jgi:hypothetical protein
MESAVAEALRGEWRVAAASVRGTSHQKTNLPCQDVLRWRVLDGGFLVAALADGAGSAALAEIGAEFAVHGALDSLSARFGSAAATLTAGDWRTALLDALKAGRAAVLAEADRRQVRRRELASTLLVAVFAATRSGAAQVGDGAVVCARAAGGPTLLTKPAASEYLNETTFLTADAALEQAQVVLEEGPIRQAAMFCDGLQLLALKWPEGTAHPGFFQPLFRFVDSVRDAGAAAEQLRAFLQSPRVAARADDDLSLLLAAWGSVLTIDTTSAPVAQPPATTAVTGPPKPPAAGCDCH